MLSKGVLRAIWLEKNHCWREFVTFYYAFLESHSLPHHNFSQVQRSFLLWNIYSTLVPLPGEREIDTLLRKLLATLTIVKLSACLFVCLFSKMYVIEFQDLCLFVCFKGKLLLLPDKRVCICSIPHGCESPPWTSLRGHYSWETRTLNPFYRINETGLI